MASLDRASVAEGAPKRPLGTATLVAVFAIYAAMATSGFQEVLGPTFRGQIFNSMALHLLSGRFDVDPLSIGDEAFVRNGQTYAYFGIFPALLRMPLVPFVEIATWSFARLSLLLALFIGAAAQALSVSLVLPRIAPAATVHMVLPLLVLAALLSGPPILLGLAGASVFDEANGWSWAFASIFAAIALLGLSDPGGFRMRHFAGMAFAAGLCLLTRPSTAFGLHVALALLMVWHIFSADRAATRIVRRILQPTILLPVMIVAMFILVAGGVNFARWGNPFLVADLRDQVYLIAQYPDRAARLDTYGLFNIQRLAYGLVYYFVPVWVVPVGQGRLLQSSITELFDAFELPPTSFLLTDPLTMLLAAVGLPALLRDRLTGIRRAPAVAVAVGLSIAPAFMLVAWYMAFRYRLDFQPLFFFLAVLGAATIASRVVAWPPARRRLLGGLLAAILIVQGLSALTHSILYASSMFGPAYEHMQDGLLQFYARRLGLT